MSREECEKCSLQNMCAKRDPDDIIIRYRQDFNKDDYDFYNTKEDVESFGSIVMKCSGFYCPFKNDDIKSMFIMMSYSTPREVWISDKESPGPTDVFYQIVF